MFLVKMIFEKYFCFLLKHFLEFSDKFTRFLQKAAESKADSHHEEKDCLNQGCQPEILRQRKIPTADIAPGTGIGADLACNTLAVPKACFLQLQVHRASLLAGTAAADALFAVTFQLRKGQDRQQRKYSSHRAQELAEEARLNRHSGHNQDHKDNPDAISGSRQLQRCKTREHIPRAGSRQISVQAEGAQQYNCKENHILDHLAGAHKLLRKLVLLFPVQQLLLRHARQPEHTVTETAECAHVAAEKASEQDRKCAQANQC